MPSQKTVSLCLNTRGLERCVMERCVTQAKTFAKMMVGNKEGMSLRASLS